MSSKKTDTHENAVFEGTVTIVSADPGTEEEYGFGDLEVEGTIFVDTIEQNTGNEGVSLEGTLFNDSTFIMKGVLPPSGVQLTFGESIFFNNETLFRSLDLEGKLTTYQPTNTLGDITVHGISTQERLSTGLEAQLLVVDQFSTVNTSWKYLRDINFEVPGIFRISLFDETDSSIVRRYNGAFLINIWALSRNGPTCNIISTKSVRSLDTGSSTILNLNRGLPELTGITPLWKSFGEIRIKKDILGYNGGYEGYVSDYVPGLTVNFTIDNWVDVPGFNHKNGILFLLVFSREENKASAAIILGKASKNDTEGMITYLNRSPGINGEKIEARWLQNGTPQIRKDNVISGTYDTLVNTGSLYRNTGVVNLQGTTPVEIPENFFGFYENKSFVVRLELVNHSNNVPHPFLLAFISKTVASLPGNFSYFQVKGGTSRNSGLSITWGVNGKLLVAQTGTAEFSGNYNFYISEI